MLKLSIYSLLAIFPFGTIMEIMFENGTYAAKIYLTGWVIVFCVLAGFNSSKNIFKGKL